MTIDMAGTWLGQGRRIYKGLPDFQRGAIAAGAVAAAVVILAAVIGDRAWDLIFMFLGGAVTAGAGWFLGFRLFQHQREADARAVASTLAPELIAVYSTIKTALEEGLSDAAIEQLKHLPERTEVYRAVLPRLGILGPEIAGAATGIKFGVDVLVQEANRMPPAEGASLVSKGRSSRRGSRTTRPQLSTNCANSSRGCTAGTRLSACTGKSLAITTTGMSGSAGAGVHRSRAG